MGLGEQLVNDLIGKIVGGVSGAAVSAILGRGQAKKIARLEAFFSELRERLNSLQSRCDDETFVDIANRVVMAAATDARTGKLFVFARVLEGTYCATLDDAHSRLFIDLAARFDVYHLHMIQTLRDTAGNDRGSKGTQPAAIGFAELESQLRHLSERNGPEMADVAVLVLSDLVNAGLVDTRERAEGSGKLLVGINPVGLLRRQVFRLSQLGELFARFVECPESSAKSQSVEQDIR